jgi:hypothetical protein
MAKIPLSAQISALRTLELAGDAYKLVRGGIVARKAEADLLRERFIAARKTLEALLGREDEVRALLVRGKSE